MTGLFGFSYSGAALKFLKGSVPAKIRGQIKRKIETLAGDPYPQGCKKLTDVFYDGEPVYRLRSGDYRILYSVKGNPHQVIVLDIDNRKDVYK